MASTTGLKVMTDQIMARGKNQNLKCQKADRVLGKFICLVTIAQKLYHHLYLNICWLCWKNENFWLLLKWRGNIPKFIFR